MRKIASYSLTFGVLLLLCSMNGEECLTLLKTAVKNTISIGTPEPGKTHYLEYVITSKYPDPKKPLVVTPVTMLIGEDRMSSKSGMIELIQDKKDAFTIVHQSKEIYRSNSTLGSVANTQAGMSAMADTLFNEMTVRKCATVTGVNYDKELQLLYSKAATEKSQISVMTYFINSANGTVKKVMADYVPGYKVQNVIIEYKVQEINSSRPIFSGTAISQVLTSGGSLLPKYKGYTLIDSRSK